jgi:hypothetical protein
MKVYLSFFGFPTKRLSNLEDAVGCHTLDNIFAVRRNQFDLFPILLDTDERGGRKLVNDGARLAVQMECDSVAIMMRLLAPPQHWRVVAADLGRSCALGRRTVELL